MTHCLRRLVVGLATALLAVTGLAVATPAVASSPRPVVTSVPDTVPSNGGRHAIHGRYFGRVEAVYVGPKRVYYERRGWQLIVADFPPLAPGGYHVRVVTSVGTSTPTAHDVVTYLPIRRNPCDCGPTILKAAPVAGHRDQVELRGLGFDTVDIVVVGDRRVPSFLARSATGLRFTTPAGLSTQGRVRVVAYQGQYPSSGVTMVNRTYLLVPTVSAVESVMPSGGGMGYVSVGNAVGVDRLYVGTTQVPVTFNEYTDSTVHLPAHAPGAYHIRAANPYAISAATPADVTYYTAAPTTTWTPGDEYDNRAGSAVDVSCPADDFCAAVDDHRVSTYDGTSWSQPTPLGATARITAISCATDRFCVAADSAGSVWTMRDGEWDNGTALATDPIVDVSCATSTACMAITSGPVYPAAYRYDGTSWRSGTSPDLWRAVAVSCGTATFCAVSGEHGVAFWRDGVWSDSGVYVYGDAFAISCATDHFCAALDTSGRRLVYDGGTWSTFDWLPDRFWGEELACSSPTRCLAVDEVGATSAWDGSGWSTAGRIDPAGQVSAATVACSASLCTAADAAGRAFRYADGTWSAPAQVFAPHGHAVSTSCVSAAFCATADAGGGVTLHAGGHELGRQAVDPGVLTDERAVSCASAAFCALVGPHGHASTWNGHTWTSPAAVVSSDVALTSVSCPTASFCMAAGDGGVTARWDGAGWIELPAATAASGAVSCVSPTWCLTNRMSWDGTRWTATSGTDDLHALSCASTTFCLATRADFGTVLMWRSGTWAPTRMTAYSVSCARSGFCATDAQYNPSVRVWTGTVWTDTTYLGSSYTQGSVSCWATNRCVVVADRYTTGTPSETP